MASQKEDKLKAWESFLVRCVIGNVKLPHSPRLGLNERYTVQDLLHLNIDTLRNIGEQIEKLATLQGSKYKEEARTQLPEGSGIYVDEWDEFILQTIAYKKVAQEQSDKARKKAELERELEQFKTPSERKKAIQEQIALLDE